MAPSFVCKPCEKPAPYACKPKVVKDKNAPRTSTQPAKNGTWDNLTLQDWITVYGFVDAHLSMLQMEVVNYFKSKADGTLVFNQATLSQKLKNQMEMEECVNSNPSALSYKCQSIVSDVQGFANP
jgi:hypothetical protein